MRWTATQPLCPPGRRRGSLADRRAAPLGDHRAAALRAADVGSERRTSSSALEAGGRSERPGHRGPLGSGAGLPLRHGGTGDRDRARGRGARPSRPRGQRRIDPASHARAAGRRPAAVERRARLPGRRTNRPGRRPGSRRERDHRGLGRATGLPPPHAGHARRRRCRGTPLRRTAPERFDAVHLGLGSDGHTASLVPGDPVVDVRDRRVAITLPTKATAG